MSFNVRNGLIDNPPMCAGFLSVVLVLYKCLVIVYLVGLMDVATSTLYKCANNVVYKGAVYYIIHNYIIPVITSLPVYYTWLLSETLIHSVVYTGCLLSNYLKRKTRIV